MVIIVPLQHSTLGRHGGPVVEAEPLASSPVCLETRHGVCRPSSLKKIHLYLY